MKWFHHECAAKHDPKLQTLGASHGAEGLGIFWGLLEEIGQHSDTFHLKVSGISAVADRSFDDILQDPSKAPMQLAKAAISVRSIPRFPHKILAKVLFTSPQKLERVIQSAIEAGLFDRTLWTEFSILYSKAFEHRADDYTRRVQRRQSAHRSVSEHCPETVRPPADDGSPQSEDVLIEQTSSELEVIKEEQSNSHATEDASGVRSQFSQFRRILSEWNAHRVNPFVWNPTDAELERLFLGGSERRRQALCRAWGGSARYADVVLRALRLMLEASEQRRIANPAGWIWSCLHGSPEGGRPWIHRVRENGRS